MLWPKAILTKRVENWLCETLRDVGVAAGTQHLAWQIMLLLAGSLTVVLPHRDPTYMEIAGKTAAQLVRAAKEA